MDQIGVHQSAPWATLDLSHRRSFQSRFREVCGRGSHRVFAHPNMAELVNLQTERGQAKRYQVRQVMSLVRKYDLSLEEKR